MNDNIRAIWNRAASSHRQADTSRETQENFINRFAELIVRECVQTLLDNTPDQFTNEAAEEDWDRGYDQAMRDCVRYIQEHFGVE